MVNFYRPYAKIGKKSVVSKKFYWTKKDAIKATRTLRNSFNRLPQYQQKKVFKIKKHLSPKTRISYGFDVFRIREKRRR